MSLPIQTTIPVSIDVPVDIGVRETELHGAIQNLQAALKPILCAATPGAISRDGTSICGKYRPGAHLDRGSIMRLYVEDPHQSSSA